MLLIGHDSMAEAEASAARLAALGAPAVKLMAQCTETSGVKRKTLSAAAKALESAGFIFVHDIGSIWADEFELRPSLTGEEALQILDELTDAQAYSTKGYQRLAV